MSTDDDHGAPGAETYLVPVWVFRLNKRDSLLVLKALGDRLTDAEVEEAKALGNRLTIHRANAARDLIESTERAAAAALKSTTKE